MSWGIKLATLHRFPSSLFDTPVQSAIISSNQLMGLFPRC
jgi:hypothetical protein